jgi:sulfite exporter TauE/SafE
MDHLPALLFAVIPLAFFHTIVCADHYIPFIAMGKSNGWTIKKTLMVTALCGTGHIVSSALLGLIGIVLSLGASNLTGIQNLRGDLAVWFLIIFGLGYMAYGILKAIKNTPHTHGKASKKTVLGLLIVFAFLPCEPMVPIIMFPAFTDGGAAGLIAVTLTYTFFTIATMVSMTYIGSKGLKMVKLKKLERYAHALAGFAVFTCGVAVMLFHNHSQSGCC